MAWQPDQSVDWSKFQQSLLGNVDLSGIGQMLASRVVPVDKSIFLSEAMENLYGDLMTRLVAESPGLQALANMDMSVFLRNTLVGRQYVDTFPTRRHPEELPALENALDGGAEPFSKWVGQRVRDDPPPVDDVVDAALLLDRTGMAESSRIRKALLLVAIAGGAVVMTAGELYLPNSVGVTVQLASNSLMTLEATRLAEAAARRYKARA